MVFLIQEPSATDFSKNGFIDKNRVLYDILVHDNMEDRKKMVWNVHKKTKCGAWHGSGDNTNTSSTLIYACAAVLRKLKYFIKINQTSPICFWSYKMIHKYIDLILKLSSVLSIEFCVWWFIWKVFFWGENFSMLWSFISSRQSSFVFLSLFLSGVQVQGIMLNMEVRRQEYQAFLLS
jgi:hypothetical protein